MYRPAGSAEITTLYAPGPPAAVVLPVLRLWTNALVAAPGDPPGFDGRGTRPHDGVARAVGVAGDGVARVRPAGDAGAGVRDRGGAADGVPLRQLRRGSRGEAVAVDVAAPVGVLAVECHEAPVSGDRGE